MTATRFLIVVALGLVSTACSDSLALTAIVGLWVADSYEYRNATGDVVDLIERDGASMTLSVDAGPAGERVSLRFDPGTGTAETMNGTVDLEGGQFDFGSTVYEVERSGDTMTMTKREATFDFGDGPEPATLTIRLTRL